MNERRWIALAAAVLVPLSVLMYGLHYALFHDAHHIFIYLVGDLAFLPAEVFLVVVVVERVLSGYERRRMLEKMNMLIGMFFQELGVDLLGRLTECVENKEALQPHLDVDQSWTRRDYSNALAAVRGFDFRIDMSRIDLTALRDSVRSQGTLLMQLLANPNLVEHEEFSDLLWAVSHLEEELTARRTLDSLPQSDLEHLGGDVRRVYVRLTAEWLRYCQHLQSSYPYIFSILARTHPLQESPDPTVA